MRQDGGYGLMRSTRPTTRWRGNWERIVRLGKFRDNDWYVFCPLRDVLYLASLFPLMLIDWMNVRLGLPVL